MKQALKTGSYLVLTIIAAAALWYVVSNQKSNGDPSSKGKPELSGIVSEKRDAPSSDESTPPAGSEAEKEAEKKTAATGPTHIFKGHLYGKKKWIPG